MKAKSTIKILLILAFLIGFVAIDNAYASETSGTIVSGGNAGYAWSDQVGWVSFGATNSNIQITDSGIAGYAWSNNYGWINMSPTNGGITVAGNGALSGYAWGSSLGWINFSGVSINSSGRFVGTASGTNVGTLTFDCVNCSVTTDFRAQNFRTVAPTPTQTTVIAGGGAILGSMPSAVSPHINAYNVPLQIDNSVQSGTLTQGFTGGLSVGVDVPRGSTDGSITINVDATTIDPLTVTTTTRIISNALFDITVTDDTGALIHSFDQPIRIAFQVPEELQGRSDIGVYFFDEENQWWERVPNVQFDGNIARFYVDHLTLFGIFSDSNLPNNLVPFFEKPITGPAGYAGITAEEEIGAFAEGEVPAELTESLPAQLFDINLEIESTKIADVKDLIARLLFTSFGRVPTPVDVTFAVVNKDGETVYSKKDTITVQTQAVLTERFSDIDAIVPAGKYTLIVTTLYNTDVRDEFKQDFEVTGETIAVPFWRSLWFWVIGGLLLIFLFIIAIKKMGEDEGASAGKSSAISFILSARYMKDIR